MESSCNRMDSEYFDQLHDTTQTIDRMGERNEERKVKHKPMKCSSKNQVIIDA